MPGQNQTAAVRTAAQDAALEAFKAVEAAATYLQTVIPGANSVQSSTETRKLEAAIAILQAAPSLFEHLRQYMKDVDLGSSF